MTLRGALRGALIHSARVLGLAALSASASGQTAPFEEIDTLSSAVVPIEREFEIPQAGGGQYRITLTDLGALLQAPGPAPLKSVHALITRGTTVVATLNGTDDPAGPATPTDTATFDATPGMYTVRIVGQPGDDAGSGPVSLRIENVASSNAVLTLGAALSPPETIRRDLRTYQTEIEVPAAGDYELTLADLSFPQPLQTAGVFLFQNGSSSLAACLSVPEVPPACPASKTVTLAAGTYQLVVAGGLPDTGSEGGVFSVHMRAVSDGTVLHSRALELGNVKKVSASLVLDAGQHTLGLIDLEFPAKLAAGSAIVTRAAQIIARADATTPEPTFTVASDDTMVDVFSYVSPDATEGAGSFRIDLRTSGGTSLLSSIEAIGSSSGNRVAYTFPATVNTAGAYRARLGDFQFPVALSAARIAIVQNGTILGKTDAADPGPTLALDLPSVATGPVTAIAIVRPATVGGTLQQGTFGLELGVLNGNEVVLDATQGTGALISVRKITFSQAGRYDLTLTDLDFPEAFRDLMAVVSRGSQRLGTLVVGSGGSKPEGGTATLPDFDASVGNYSVTIITQPGEDLQAATYTISLKQSPPGPTVTLDADPRSITGSGTTRLTWSSQNATSCTASSNPSGAWSGTKATSGNENSASISAATTFTLRCTGPGNRTSEASVNVTVAAASTGGGGGGGVFGWLGLAGVAVLALRRACGRARLIRPIFPAESAA